MVVTNNLNGQKLIPKIRDVSCGDNSIGAITGRWFLSPCHSLSSLLVASPSTPILSPHVSFFSPCPLTTSETGKILTLGSPRLNPMVLISSDKSFEGVVDIDEMFVKISSGPFHSVACTGWFVRRGSWQREGGGGDKKRRRRGRKKRERRGEEETEGETRGGKEGTKRNETEDCDLAFLLFRSQQSSHMGVQHKLLYYCMFSRTRTRTCTCTHAYVHAHAHARQPVNT